VPYSYGRRTRYRMTMIPILMDAFTSQDWRIECILELSLNGVTITSFDPRFLPVHHRTADVLARFRRPLGCFGDTDRLCYFGVGHVLYLVSAPNW
jgi:hypothetical protein